MRLPFFVGGSYVSRSSIVDPEECVNFFVERTEAPGASAQEVHYPTPGFTSLCTEAVDGASAPFPVDGPIRGMIAVDTVTAGVPSTTSFFVGGPYAYQIPSGLTVAPYVEPTPGNRAERISISRSITPAPMPVDRNPARLAYSGSAGTELLVASGGAVYRYRYDAFASWTSAPVLASSFGILTIGFLDGFFLALDSSTTLRISDSFAGTVWDPTQIKVRSAKADPWVSMLVVHDDIWLFGTRTTDVYWNAGTSPFPFQARDGVSIQQGTAAPFSAAELDNAPIWLGKNVAGQGMVFHAQGYVPQRVSTFALEAAIGRYSTISDAEGFSFLFDGHWFYVLTFPTANASWMYDASNKVWARVGYWNPRTLQYDAYRAACHAFINNTHLVGDRQSGTIYTASMSVSTEMDGTGIRRMRRTPRYEKDGKRLFFRNLEIDAEMGLGLTSGQGSDPQIMLRWSDDAGKTWSNELWRSAGEIGQYRVRAAWERLGSSRKGRVFEIVVSDPIPWRLANASIDITEGLH